jgi:hypothetical protein
MLPLPPPCYMLLVRSCRVSVQHTLCRSELPPSLFPVLLPSLSLLSSLLPRHRHLQIPIIIPFLPFAPPACLRRATSFVLGHAITPGAGYSALSDPFTPVSVIPLPLSSPPPPTTTTTTDTSDPFHNYHPPTNKHGVLAGWVVEHGVLEGWVVEHGVLKGIMVPDAHLYSSLLPPRHLL